MTHHAIPGGDVYLAGTACGCDPDRAHRPHACTNAGTSWVRLVPDAAGSLPAWIRIRSGVRVWQSIQRGADMTEVGRVVDEVRVSV